MKLKLPSQTTWDPPKSPWNLVQEPYFGDEWKILVCCILLNLTTHKQVRKILPEFFERYPGPNTMVMADEEDGSASPPPEIRAKRVANVRSNLLKGAKSQSQARAKVNAVANQ